MHATARRGSAAPTRSRRPGSATRRSFPSRTEPPRNAVLDAALDAAQASPSTPVESFAELGLPTVLVDALVRRGMRAPFAIQARALPDALAGRDVLGRAQTGSGKTLAFMLPVLTRLAAGEPRRRPKFPRAIVLVPTRELALQVKDAAAPLADSLRLRVTTVVGGAPYGRQIDALNRGADVVVATPGRLIDLIERGVARLDAVEITVLDEADYMADLGFMPAVTRILDLTPDGAQRLLFSATLDGGVGELVERYLHDPAFHAVAAAAAPVDAMDHRVFTVRRHEKNAVAAEVAARPGRTLFFVRTKLGADRLVSDLAEAGVDAAAIHGDLRQAARRRALAAFAEGSPRVLVATDVAARGIHVDGVDLVVHYDPPNDHKDYLHRSGRTARAGARGTVVAFVAPNEVRKVRRLHEAAGVAPDVHEVRPGHEAVREVAESGEPIVVRRPARGDRRDGPGRGGAGRGARTGGRQSRYGDRRGSEESRSSRSSHRPGGPRRDAQDRASGPRRPRRSPSDG